MPFYATFVPKTVSVFSNVKRSGASRAPQVPLATNKDLSYPTIEESMSQLSKLVSQAAEFCKELADAQEKSHQEARHYLQEVIFCAKHVGIDVGYDKMVPPASVEKLTFEECVTKIESVISAIIARISGKSSGGGGGKAKSTPKKAIKEESAVAGDEIFSIYAGGTIVMVQRSTLAYAPEHSLLTKIGSEFWTTDTDKAGNYFQDVNPDLFEQIVNFLRLKRLKEVSGRSDIHSCIHIERSQRPGLNRLLTFYGLDGVTVVEH